LAAALQDQFSAELKVGSLGGAAPVRDVGKAVG
jgi:hypothetical protein